MNEPALTEAVKTDLPSLKPSRGKRLALRFAALVAAVSGLGAAYWFTRPPELVWWRSPILDKSGRHVTVLIPNGWELDTPAYEWNDGSYWHSQMPFHFVDRTPHFLRLIP